LLFLTSEIKNQIVVIEYLMEKHQYLIGEENLISNHLDGNIVCMKQKQISIIHKKIFIVRDKKFNSLIMFIIRMVAGRNMIMNFG
jgi:hypothetical protein